MSAYETFISNININQITNMVNVHGISIYVKMQDISKEESKVKFDKEQGQWSIIFNNTGRTIKELMFDWYRMVGQILIQVGRLDTRIEKAWLNTNYSVDMESEDFYEKMTILLASDKYAYTQMDYRGDSSKLIQTYSDTQDTRFGRQRSIRRKYLEHLNISRIKDIKTSTNVVKPVEPITDSPLMKFCKNANIMYDYKMTFSELCKHIISAVTSQNIRFSCYNIPATKFVRVMKEPTDWNKKYHKYYRCECSLYNKIPKVKEGEKVPEFSSTVYQEVKTDEAEEIENIRTSLKPIITKFLIPWFKKYNSFCSQKERKEIEAVINYCMLSHLNDHMIPTQAEIDMYLRSYKRLDAIDKNMKTNTMGLMTYKDKIEKIKKKYPKTDRESEAEYKERINTLYIEGSWK